jgi:nucleoside-triphosphatase THEP1
MKSLVIITSEINSGKTQTLEKISNALKAKNISVGGFLSIAEFEKGKKVSYHLKNIATDEEVPIATQRKFDTSITIGKYFFYEHAFDKANDWLTDTRQLNVIIIDEVGPLEMRGGGFYELLTNLFQDFKGVLIIAVRNEILEEFRIKFPHPETAIFTTNTNIKEIVDYIVL